MNRQERAIARAHRAVRQMAYLDVIYVTTEDQRISLRAVKTEADIEILEQDGSTTVDRATNWRIHAEDLIIGGRQIRPSIGDKIEWETDSGKRVYTIMPVGGEDCYEEADPYGLVYKLYSKLTSE